ncbi:MAG: hypothetical protein ABJ263_15075 [Tateyamaria sp.]|uniref:hypothetical protein n=1 Tax=Tateyamaria sp. TaxID=1929288 RepID=UPI0032774678
MTWTGIKETTIWKAVRKGKAKTTGFLIGAATRHIILPRAFRLVVFAGLKRSGNHAFINWFLNQSHGPCAFFNHVPPHQYPTDRFRREFRLNNSSALPTVVFSYEDHNLSDIFNGALQDFIGHHATKIESRSACLILRDPRNLMASRFRKWPQEHLDTGKADGLVNLWKDYAVHALEGRRPDPAFETVPVYYNHFITDAAYRTKLSQKLDIRDGVQGLDEVTSYGHGSSFSDTNQPDMKGIFKRWEHYEADPSFQRLFADGTLCAFARRLEALR